MNTLPQPLTPADCDLRDFAFMPLDVVRLRDSDLAVTADADEFRCAVLLWCAAWHQVPAASLPDDDKALAQYAGYGRVVKEWLKVRKGALRGWVKCSDSRLYHPVVAEKARDAWDAKLKQRLKTECARIKKHNDRHGTRVPFPDFDAWLSSGCPVGQPLFVPRDTLPLSPDDVPIVPSETASKGQGEGQGQGQGEGQGQSNSKTRSKTTPAASPPATPSALPGWLPPDAWAAFVAMRKSIKKPITADGIPLALRKLDELRAAGHDPRAVLDQSVLSSWAGLFEIKPEARVRGSPGAGSNFEQTRASAERAKKMIFGDGNEAG